MNKQIGPKIHRQEGKVEEQHQLVKFDWIIRESESGFESDPIYGFFFFAEKSPIITVQPILFDRVFCLS